jgi:hypothetical protein
MLTVAGVRLYTFSNLLLKLLEKYQAVRRTISTRLKRTMPVHFKNFFMTIVLICVKIFAQKAWCKGGGRPKGGVIKSVANAFKFVAIKKKSVFEVIFPSYRQVLLLVKLALPLVLEALPKLLWVQAIS